MTPLQIAKALPGGHSETPSASIDVVTTDFLKSLRARDIALLHSLLSSRTGLAYSPKPPVGPSTCLTSTIHFVVSGSCAIEVGQERRVINQGDIALLSTGGTQSILGNRCSGASAFEDIARPGATGGFWTAEHGCETDDRLEIISANVYWESCYYEPLIFSLPSLIVDEFEATPLRTVLLDALRTFAVSASDNANCVEVILRNLVESLVSFILQRYARDQKNHSRGLFLGAHDRLVARAMQLLHQNVRERWSVADLARKIGSSRSVLNDRFRKQIGQAPIEYLTTLRMKHASRQLGVPGESISAIARSVGYESEAAFNRAFKRFFGQAPGQWRDKHRARPANAIAAPSLHRRDRAA